MDADSPSRNGASSSDGGLILIISLLIGLLLPILLLFRDNVKSVANDESKQLDPNISIKKETEESNSKSARPNHEGRHREGPSFASSDEVDAPRSNSQPLSKKEPSSSTSNATTKASNVENGAGTSTWRCACEGGFLPAGMFGNAEAVLRMGSGQCYHKQK
jgi:cytoskeletal protein RodZ